MKNKLIFLTTAITRHELHQETIGKLYKTYFEELNKYYEIHHIINIDMPLPLRYKSFSYTRTKQLFKKIIPDNVNKYFLINKLDENPSFIKAYNNVIMYLKNINILDKNALVWWLEDDWKVINNTNFIPLLKILNMNTNGAISLCDRAPMCSFRGGPIMNYLFFMNFFNNYNITSDPEDKVSRIIQFNRKIPVYENDIYIVLLFMKKDIKSYPIDMNHSCYWWYKRKYTHRVKMSEGKTFQYIIGIIDNNSILFKQSTNANELSIKKNEINNLNKVNFDNFNKYLEKKTSISYITIYPHIFEDIGRKFNAKNNLKSPKQI